MLEGANRWKVLPETIDVKFCQLRQGINKRNGLGELVITSRNLPITDEGITTMMDFMDGFLAHENAQGGFSITYDMRALRTPSMTVVTRVAQWGAHPQRQQAWATLNQVCKVVVPGGMVFKLAKGLLSTFFYACPPVCDTYLITDPDEPDEKGAYFAPPKKASIKDKLPTHSGSSDKVPTASAPRVLTGDAHLTETLAKKPRGFFGMLDPLPGCATHSRQCWVDLMGLPQASHWGHCSGSALM